MLNRVSALTQSRLLANITTLVLNKWLFVWVKFTYPLTLTALHMFACTVGSVIILHGVKLVKWTRLPPREIITRVAPQAYVVLSGFFF